MDIAGPAVANAITSHITKSTTGLRFNGFNECVLQIRASIGHASDAVAFALAWSDDKQHKTSLPGHSPPPFPPHCALPDVVRNNNGLCIIAVLSATREKTDLSATLENCPPPDTRLRSRAGEEEGC